MQASKGTAAGYLTQKGVELFSRSAVKHAMGI